MVVSLSLSPSIPPFSLPHPNWFSLPPVFSHPIFFFLSSSSLSLPLSSIHSLTLSLSFYMLYMLATHSLTHKSPIHMYANMYVYAFGMFNQITLLLIIMLCLSLLFSLFLSCHVHVGKYRSPSGALLRTVPVLYLRSQFPCVWCRAAIELIELV